MPLYEYLCEACGNRFERIQKFSDPPADTCPSCGGAVRKLMSSPAIQFKGSGWYITDYAKKSSPENSKSGGSGSSGSGSGDSASSSGDSAGGSSSSSASGSSADSGGGSSSTPASTTTKTSGS